MSTPDRRIAAAEGAPVVAIWREPFSFGAPTVEYWRPGMTVYEIVKSMRCLPAEFEERGVVMINGHEVNRGAWHLVRPKPSLRTKPIAVTFHLAMRGGKKGGSGKQIIGIVALLALTVFTAGIAGGLLGPAGALSVSSSYFAAGSISAKILAGSIGLVGALTISALTRPPATKANDDSTDNAEAAGAEGNVLEPNGSVPRVIGTRKAFPPMACEPRVELVGDDEFVEALYILNGPHAISEIKIGDAAIDDDEAVEYQIREGWPSDSLQTLVNKIGRTNAVNLELKGHKYASNSDFNLEDQAHPDKSIPKFQRVASRGSPDEIHIHLLWPSNVIYSEDPTIPMAQPVRIRMRKSGDVNWINLPELHMMGGQKPTQIRAQVVIHWDYTGQVAPKEPPAAAQGWIFAHGQVPAQSAAPADPTYQWVAHSHFYSGSGWYYLLNGIGFATGIQNIGFDGQGDSARDGGNSAQGSSAAHIYLDSATFPKGIYEIEIVRGSAYRMNLFNLTTYAYQGGIIRNFFRYYTASSAQRVPQTQRSINDNLVLTRVVSVWNELPLPYPGFATIAIRAKNKSVQQVSCMASGFVKDWDGSGWNTWTTTSNPAPHFRDILSGRLNLDPVPIALVDDDMLTEWRQACIDNDYTCDMIVDDMRIEDALSIVASCGYARPYWSEVWGVVRDYDRSAEPPVQVFTPRNSRGFKWKKAFARLPDGLLISYRSDAENYRMEQVAVYRGGIEQSGEARLEQAQYEGLIDEAKIRKRGGFDLKQGELRSTFYSHEAPAEAIVCRKGSLVAVNRDILQRTTGSARITRVIKSGGDITAIEIDAEIDLKNEAGFGSIPDILAVDDILDVGVTMGCLIRRADGTKSVHALSNASGRSNLLTFATPFPDETTSGGPFDPGTISKVTRGCLISVGPLGEEYVRMIVTEILPSRDLTAQITMVDEAPELWAA